MKKASSLFKTMKQRQSEITSILNQPFILVEAKDYIRFDLVDFLKQAKAPKEALFVLMEYDIRNKPAYAVIDLTDNAIIISKILAKKDNIKQEFKEYYLNIIWGRENENYIIDFVGISTQKTEEWQKPLKLNL